jgi:tetratricopeptide (TPR) repeat protein
MSRRSAAAVSSRSVGVRECDLLMSVPGPVRSPDLIGRDDELAACRAAVRAAGGGHGAFLMVTGEAGIGKSRLADEVVRQAVAAGGVLVIRGWAASGDAPYRPLAQALIGAGIDAREIEDPAFDLFRAGLSRLLPGLPVRSASESAESAGADPILAVAEGLFLLLARRAARGVAMLVIEDSHLADAETLRALQFLRHAVSRGPVVVLATARSDERWDPEFRALARGPLVTRIELDRWTPDRIAEFAGSAGRPLSPGAVDALAAASGGVPLLVEELLGVADQQQGRSTAGSAAQRSGRPPSGFSALISDRLERLHAEHRRVIRAAAVLPEPGDFALVAAATDRPVEEVLEALRAATAVGLMARSTGPVGDQQGGSGAWGWRHALTRDAVLDSAIPPERAAWAARAAEAMRARLDEPTGNAQASRAALTELWADAGRADLAAWECVELSRDAVREGSLAGAERWLARAAELRPHLPNLAADRVAVLTQSGRGAEALEIGAPELDRLHGRERSVLCLELARAAIVDEQWSRALELVESSGVAHDPRGDIVAADAYFGAGEVDRARHLAQRALDILEARAASTPTDRDLAAARCEAWDVLGRTRFARDPAGGEEAYRQAARIAADVGLTTWRVRALVSVGIAELSRLDISPALTMARDLAVSTGQLAIVASVDLLLSDSAMVVDGPDAARDSGLACADLAGRLGLDRLSAMGSLLVAQTYALSGNAAQMSDTLATALDRSPDTPGVAALADCVRGLHRLVTGDLEGARDRLDRASRCLPARRQKRRIPSGGVGAGPDGAGRPRRAGARVDAGRSGRGAGNQRRGAELCRSDRRRP